MRIDQYLCLIFTFVSLAAAGGEPPRPDAKMTFLDNGEVRIGMDLALGGAVTFISSRDHPGNIINSADLGRQIQMSHYSGPWPFEVGDKKPHKAWAGLGWNPIQTGDCYMNPSQVVEHRNDGRELYIKCIPMQWPLNNVPGDCVFETWTTLEGPVIHTRFRCTNGRSDQTFYRPCSQELPAVYTISKLWRLMSYTGDKPFTGDTVTHVQNDWRKPWPWTRFVATERWAALVDDHDWGLGVFKDDGGEFHGGIHGDGRSDDPKHGSTAYVAPIHLENFDHNIVYEHRTDCVVGTLADIRRRCNDMATKMPPAWRFVSDRQHWTIRDATDQGFPMRGEWRVKFGARKPRLESGTQCWRAESAPGMDLELAYTGRGTTARLFWKRLDDDKSDLKKSLTLELNPDGMFHRYQLDLASSPEYRGLIIGVAIEPVAAPRPGEEIAIKSIAMSSSRESADEAGQADVTTSGREGVEPGGTPLPRIVITTNAAGAAFSVKPEGSPLLLKGFNYIRLRQGDHATFDAATKGTAAYYDSHRAEAMLGTLQSNGFNVVRVFIIGRNAVNPGIGGDSQETKGVFGPYMNNVLDFIRRAEHHGVYVFPTFGDGELPRNRFYQTLLNQAHPGINAIYFTREGIAAKARYVGDFLRYIKSREPRLLTALLGVQCQNELSVNSNEWPFTVKQGHLEMPNGKSYDMTDAAQRRALMNEGLAYYHRELKKAVNAVDPHLLVAEGIFTMAAVGKSLETHQGIWPDSSKDKRFPPDLVALGQSPLDFLDIHFYRGNKREDLAQTFRAHMHSSLLDTPEMLTIRQRKPVILGEFGAFRLVESSYAEVVPNMVTIRDLALKAEIKGYLYWTYDCAEQKELYYVTEDDGILLKKL